VELITLELRFKNPQECPLEKKIPLEGIGNVIFKVFPGVYLLKAIKSNALATLRITCLPHPIIKYCSVYIPNNRFWFVVDNQ
jgi:hypothetical protein